MTYASYEQLLIRSCPDSVTALYRAKKWYKGDPPRERRLEIDLARFQLRFKDATAAHPGFSKGFTILDGV